MKNDPEFTYEETVQVTHLILHYDIYAELFVYIVYVCIIRLWRTDAILSADLLL